MGTLLVSNHGLNGWLGRSGSNLLPGRELCRAAWGGAFGAFGRNSAEDGPLLVVAVGPQDDPLGDLKVPANALCVPDLPQVELLEAGVSVFLTHGGQNSFTEAMRFGVPVVVCPGFGDQVVNAQKAVALGVGLKVDRPSCNLGQESSVAVEVRSVVKSALLEVDCCASFREA